MKPIHWLLISLGPLAFMCVAGFLGHPILAGALAAAAFVVLSGLWHGPMGKDGQLSSSKLQLILWNAVFAYCFVAFWFLAWRFPGLVAPQPREWIWAAIGLSSGTALAAKGITVGQISAGRLQETTKSDVSTAQHQTVGTRAGAIISDDSGRPDITKIQLLFWTVIGVLVVAAGATHVVFEVAVIAQEAAKTRTALPPTIADLFQYPDLDITLLVLTGLGQGVYLGNKLMSSEKPYITGVVPSVIAVGETVTIVGGGFGMVREEGQVQLDGVPIDLLPWKDSTGTVQPVEWKNDKIVFAMPNSVGGRAGAKGVPYRLRVLVRTVPSANEATVTLS